MSGFRVKLWVVSKMSFHPTAKTFSSSVSHLRATSSSCFIIISWGILASRALALSTSTRTESIASVICDAGVVGLVDRIADADNPIEEFFIFCWWSGCNCNSSSYAVLKSSSEHCFLSGFIPLGLICQRSEPCSVFGDGFGLFKGLQFEFCGLFVTNGAKLLEEGRFELREFGHK